MTRFLACADHSIRLERSQAPLVEQYCLYQGIRNGSLVPYHAMRQLVDVVVLKTLAAKR